MLMKELEQRNLRLQQLAEENEDLRRNQFTIEDFIMRAEEFKGTFDEVMWEELKSMREAFQDKLKNAHVEVEQMRLNHMQQMRCVDLCPTLHPPCVCSFCRDCVQTSSPDGLQCFCSFWGFAGLTTKLLAPSV